MWRGVEEVSPLAQSLLDKSVSLDVRQNAEASSKGGMVDGVHLSTYWL